ncbi:MAG TPA: hypothetical protein VJ183_15725 [Chloroflexia bacterium]|nr:hypothetical protein [Chloroflexia bacterium]
MEGLRWIRRPQGSQGSNQRTRPRLTMARMLPLLGAERRMAEALDQLRAGVPLNWTQVEDDPELATLSYLEDVASEYRGRAVKDTPAALRADILDDLSKRLPKPKPVVVKEAPKSLAGFSESVPVLTQAEEKVPQLSSRAPQIAGVIVLAVGAIFLLNWVLSALLTRPPDGMPTYRWIEVKQDGKALSRVQRPSDWIAPKCQGYDFSNAAVRRGYISIPDTQQIQAGVGFPIAFMPRILAVPEPPTSTAMYAMNVSNMGIAPCEESFSTSDRGASVRIEYMANLSLENGVIRTFPVSTFQAQQMPTTLNVGIGTWKEVTVGDAHGIYWRGGPYRDMSGSMWIGDVSVMIVERGDSVLIFVGEFSAGATEEFVTEAVSTIVSQRQSEENVKSEGFTWINVWRGNQQILPRKLPDDWKPPECFGATQQSLFSPTKEREATQERVGYPIVALPQSINGPSRPALVRQVEDFISPTITDNPWITITLPTTYTLSFADIAILTCTREPADPDAKVKLRYVVRFAARERTDDGREIMFMGSDLPQLSDIIIFQTRRSPESIRVEGGTWKEVKVGDARGIYWSGSQYRDMEGLFWQDGANVLMVERGDMVVTLISRRTPEVLLMSVAERIDWTGSGGQ